MTGDELRQAYLSFFESKGHKVISSSSLVPHGDPTLLLTSAGMVPVKPYFLGEAVPPSRRLASCQKCFRTTDIELVGDATHLTFFEMLGNFSVGDYFKQEAIGWAWEFVIQHLKLLPERLWITILLDDDQSFDIWRQVGVPEQRIVRLGEDDNFWGPAGSSGPCGPCSEIHYDFGEEVGCRQADCAPGCQCGRFTEIWNLVFTQYNQDKDGQRLPLPRPNIDTGMGLERTAAIMQGKTSVYETDLFAPLLERVSGLAAKKYGYDEATDNAMRIVAEHSRGIAFLIVDGVMPGNEGRGYVLRRLLRRAALFGRQLGMGRPFLDETALTTIKQMAHVYPELARRQEYILKVIRLEEERFSETLNTGLEVIEGLLDYREGHRGAIPELVPFLRDSRPASENAARVLEQHGFVGGGWETGRQVGAEMAAEVVSQLTRNFLKELEEEGEPSQDILDEIERWSQQVSGNEVFRLYDTYGFPVELTREVAGSRGFSVDMEGFEREMARQRERARASHRFELAPRGTAGREGQLDIKATVFTGYDELRRESVVVRLLVGDEPVEIISEGQGASLLLESTPFYGEMGGQVGDSGEIRSASGRFVVSATVRMPPDIIVHQGRVSAGSLSVGDEVTAEVDEARRLDIARNHTATHLLQLALRQVLGDHVQQRGSLVSPDHLRFDFSHLVGMSQEEIGEGQRIVNDMIRQNLPVYDERLPYQRAIEEGAIALFDEKYGDVVRVLRIGKPQVSAELCGGTHVISTGEIGFFHITSEGSIGAGLRRLEAVTGRGAEGYIAQRLTDLEQVTRYLEAEPDTVLDKAQSLSLELRNERRQRQAVERELARKEAESLEEKAEEVRDGIKLLAVRVSDNTSIDTLREMSDGLKDKLGRAIVVLGTLWEDKPVFVVNVAPGLVAEGYHAGKIVKQVAAVTGGGGGGKATLAQGGGKDKTKLEEALRLVRSLI